MINNIKGEKRIDLSYSIQNFDSGKEIAVIRMLNDNVKYEILKLRAVMDPISDVKKTIPIGTYAGRELRGRPLFFYWGGGVTFFIKKIVCKL